MFLYKPYLIYYIIFFNYEKLLAALDRGGTWKAVDSVHVQIIFLHERLPICNKRKILPLIKNAKQL